MHRFHPLSVLGALLLAALLAVPCGGQARFTNPVLHQDFSDPDICRVGEDYYLTASSFNCFPGLPVLHSRDLVHWRQVGAALTDYPGEGFTAPEDDFHGTVQHGNGVWAPAIRYHDGWFYIFAGDPDRGIFMVRTKDPRGTWEPPVWLVRGKGFIDPCPLWDEDGKAYLSHAAAGSRAGLKSVLWVAPMRPDGTALLGPSRAVFDGHLTQPTIEGTKFYRREGYYYIFAPAGGVATGWQTVLRSRSPFGPFEEKVVLAWAPGTVNGPHQGGWVEAPDGSHWFLHFQDKEAYGRIVHLQPMAWREDGWPVIGEDPDGDGVGRPVSRWKVPSFDADAENNSDTGPYGLGWDWQYPAVPSAFWHMALPEGGVRLYSVEQAAPGLWNCPNLLQRKFPAERFTVEARLRFRPNPQLKEKGETAGFVVMGTDYAGLFLVDTPEGAALQYRRCKQAPKGGEEETEPLCVLPYAFENQAFEYASGNVPAVAYPPRAEAQLWVRLEVRPKAVEGNVPEAVCRFSWSRDGKRWERMQKTFNAAPGRWIGAKFGFFCNRYAPKNDAGWLDVTELFMKPEFAPLEGFVYEEAEVPDYTLPELLRMEDGRPVGNRRQWESRRKELLALFESEMFGTAPPRPEGESWTLLAEDPAALGGKATRQEVRVNLGGGEYLTLLLYRPNGAEGPVPAFLGVNFFGNHTVSEDPGIGLPDTLRCRRNFVLDARGSQAHRWPLDTILSRGYAVATFCCEDVAPDDERDYAQRVMRLYQGYTWGGLAAWAWGLSRAMDYLENCPAIGPVAVFGHSRMGKAALWAAMQDERFAMYISDASGCGGAALSRRRYGETLRRINTHFPHWFTPRFHCYNDNEPLLPFDQHEALALIAPRPVYLESASEDRWSDPHGEFLGLAKAAPAYALYGLQTLTEADEPGVEEPVTRGPSGYHIRRGRHQILLYDWLQFLDFADKWLR